MQQVLRVLFTNYSSWGLSSQRCDLEEHDAVIQEKCRILNLKEGPHVIPLDLEERERCLTGTAEVGWIGLQQQCDSPICIVGDTWVMDDCEGA